MVLMSAYNVAAFVLNSFKTQVLDVLVNYSTLSSNSPRLTSEILHVFIDVFISLLRGVLEVLDFLLMTSIFIPR